MDNSSDTIFYIQEGLSIILPGMHSLILGSRRLVVGPGMSSATTNVEILWIKSQAFIRISSNDWSKEY